MHPACLLQHLEVRGIVSDVTADTFSLLLNRTNFRCEHDPEQDAQERSFMPASVSCGAIISNSSPSLRDSRKKKKTAKVRHRQHTDKGKLTILDESDVKPSGRQSWLHSHRFEEDVILVGLKPAHCEQRRIELQRSDLQGTFGGRGAYEHQDHRERNRDSCRVRI